MPNEKEKYNIIKQMLDTIGRILGSLSLLLGIKKEKGYKEFTLAVRNRESGNNYQAVNPYGYLGAYQFGMPRLADLGYAERSGNNYVWKKGYSKEWFLNNPDVQDRIFREHVIDLVNKIKAKYSQYIGKKIDDTTITLSGLVMGAHLGGIGGLGKYLQGIGDNQDAFGTKISDYIKEFSGYDLEI